MPDHARWTRRAFLAATAAGVTGLAVGVPAATAATGPWSNPTFGRISSGYRTPSRPNHLGTDVANSQGTPIHAACAGTVAAVRTNSYPGDLRTGLLPGRTGNGIIVNHADGYRTYYGHLHTVRVAVGQRVAPGEHIGAMGTTGNSTGPHLHLEVHLNGVTTNPYTFLANRGITLGSTRPRSGAAGWPTVRNPLRSEPARVAQYLLSYRGYSLVPDGYFGPASADAAARYQRSRGLVADGVIGPVTWPVLTPDVRLGASGRQVRAVQVGLNTWGARLSVDGDFGSVTDGAVRTFQSRNGLVVDGWVGNTTWSYLV